MCYSIGLNNRETPLILKIQEYFKGIGSIVESIDNNMVKYEVASLKDLNEFIIPQFDRYKFCHIRKEASELFNLSQAGQLAYS